MVFSASAVAVTDKAPQVLTVKQKVGSNGTLSVTANISPLLNTSAGFGPGVTKTVIRLPGAIGSVPAYTVSVGQSESSILAGAITHFKTYGPQLSLQMKSWMGKNGVSFAWFSYEQTISVSYPKLVSTGTGTTGRSNANTGVRQEFFGEQRGSPLDSGSTGPLTAGVETRLLLWTMSTDQNGRLIFGNPKIVPDRPKTLYVVYTPLAIGEGLPTTWTYPNAGTLFVQTRDDNFTPLPGTNELINVGGTFDEATDITTTEGESGVAFNPDSKIPCLMNHVLPGCSNTVSVRSLMDARGASAAVVDYVRKIQPVFNEVPIGSGNLVAEATIRINERTVSLNGCAEATYYNKGEFGFKLNSTVTRFLLSPEGDYAAVGEVQNTEISPTTPYEGTLVIKAVDISKLPGLVINPLNPTSPLLMDVTKLPITPPLAAVEMKGSFQEALINSVTGHLSTGLNNLAAHAYVGCDGATGLIQFSAGWQDIGVNSAINWLPDVNRYSKGVVFTKGIPESLPIYSREDPKQGYCSGTAFYNGVKSITLNMNNNCAYGDNLIHGNYQYGVSGTPEYAEDGLISLFPRFCPAGTRYAAVTGDMWIPGENFGESGTANSIRQVSIAGCVYDDKSGLLVTTYELMPYGPLPANCNNNGDGSCQRDLGSCPSSGDYVVFTDSFFANMGGDNQNEKTYTARSCVRKPSSTWTLSW